MTASLSASTSLAMSLTQSQLAALPTTDIAALSTTDIGALTAGDLGVLTSAQIQAFTNVQIAAIQPTALNGATQAFSEFTRREIGSLTDSQVAALTTAEVMTLTKNKLASMSAHQINSISAAAFAGIGPGRIASLTTTQIAGLTSGQVLTFGKGKLAAMSAEQIAAIDPAALAALGVGRIGSLSPAQAGALTSLQISALTVAERNSLTVAAAQISSTQIAAMNAAQLNNLGGEFLSQYNPAIFSWDQIAGLNGVTISKLTSNFFQNLPIDKISAISQNFISSISVAQLQSLDPIHLEKFSAKQMSLMDDAQLSVIANVNPFIAQAGVLAGNGNLGYSEIISILQNAASNNMDQTKFAQLEAFGKKIEGGNAAIWGVADDVIVLNEPLAQIFHNVVLGNAENTSYFNGGIVAHSMGDLSSSSTSEQFGNLIDKWFMGSDLPSLQVDPNGDVSSATYINSTLSLFGPSGSPTMSDVRQGSLSDSALLASIAETALHDPGYIKHLITDNGNNTYTIDLPNLFGSTYVTVNNELPVAQDGTGMAVANATTGKWVALLEKAAAQNAVNTAVANGEGPSALGNSYAALTLPSNSDDNVTQYSGEFLYSQSFKYGTQEKIHQTLDIASNAFYSGQNVILQSGTDFYAVTGIDAPEGTVEVYNAASGSTSNLTMSSTADQTLYYNMAAGGRIS